MGEEPQLAINPHQQQHMCAFGQTRLGRFEPEFVGQARLTQDPSLFLALVDILNTQTGRKQRPSAQAGGERMAIIIINRIAQLEHRIAPDLEGKFIADERIIASFSVAATSE